jgi:hypothetical protein
MSKLLNEKYDYKLWIFLTWMLNNKSLNINRFFRVYKAYGNMNAIWSIFIEF